MLKKNEGHIVSIASIAGWGGTPDCVDYCASKHAAVGFMEALRQEINKDGKNIVCTTVCPYLINTGMF